MIPYSNPADGVDPCLLCLFCVVLVVASVLNCLISVAKLYEILFALLTVDRHQSELPLKCKIKKKKLVVYFLLYVVNVKQLCL
jgi:hypothetical protein